MGALFYLEIAIPSGILWVISLIIWSIIHGIHRHRIPKSSEPVLSLKPSEFRKVKIVLWVIFSIIYIITIWMMQVSIQERKERYYNRCITEQCPRHCKTCPVDTNLPRGCNLDKGVKVDCSELEKDNPQFQRYTDCLTSCESFRSW